MARLSILIPVLNKLNKLEDTLVSILENRPRDCQIVVLLNEPYADPYQLRDEVSFIEVAGNLGLIETINVGLAQCRAPIVHLLSCGMEVSPGWADAAVSHFADPDIAAVAPFVLQRLDHEKTVSAGVDYRAGGAARRIGYGKSPADALLEKKHFFGADILASFYRRSALDAVGGLNPAIGGHLSGVDLALALHFAGFHCICEPECKMYADPKDAIGAGRLGGGRAAERLFWTWVRRFGRFRALFGHAMLVAEECFESVVRPFTLMRLVGRAWETMQLPFHSGYERPDNTRPSSAGHPISAPHFAVKRCRQATISDK